VQPSPRWTTTPCHRVRKPSTAKGCESHFRAKTRRRIRLPSNWHFQNPGWTVYGCFLNVLTRLRGPKAREHLLAVRPKTRVVSRAESPRIGENAAPTHQSQPIFTTNPPQEGFWAPFFRFPCRYARSKPHRCRSTAFFTGTTLLRRQRLRAARCELGALARSGYWSKSHPTKLRDRHRACRLG
jgi:hypothetical protein